MPSTLSLFLIVKNEEKHIENVLKNTHFYADEIVVVDTGSTDKTKEIASRFTKNIFDFPWNYDFSKARNFAIKKCTKDYVMWLDADDVVLDNDAVKIKKLLSKHDAWDVYFMPYHYLYNKNKSSSVVVSRERIFRNFKQIYFDYPVHECLMFPESSTLTVSIDIPVFHKNIEKRGGSTKRNISILKKALKREEYKNSARMWWCFAREYMYSGQNALAIKFFKEALIKRSESLSKYQESQMYYEMSTQLIDNKEFEQAKIYLNKAIEIYSNWREPYFLSAKLESAFGNFDTAINFLLTCKKIPIPISKEVLNLSLYNNKIIYKELSGIYFREGGAFKSFYYLCRYFFI